MSHRNRVLPTGEIVAARYRGDWMGNRGGPISPAPDRRQWLSVHWIYCQLNFKDRQRVFRNPGRKYTELFFFDEAIALAAGHRPCGECQYQRLREYKAATFDASVSVAVIDSALHEQRLSPEYGAAAGLPPGTFVRHDDRYLLLWPDATFSWEPERGYTETAPLPASAQVRILTPELTRRALAAGFAVDRRSSRSARPNP